MGKSTISMGIFNSYVKLPEGSVNIFRHQKGQRLPQGKLTDVEESPFVDHFPKLTMGSPHLFVCLPLG